MFFGFWAVDLGIRGLGVGSLHQEVVGFGPEGFQKQSRAVLYAKGNRDYEPLSIPQNLDQVSRQMSKTTHGGSKRKLEGHGSTSLNNPYSTPL